MARAPFTIGGLDIAPGTRVVSELPISRLSDHTAMRLAVQVFHGKRDGPTAFVCAAIHGDEIIGVEIIRQLAKLKLLQGLRGTLILVPVVNSFGFNAWSRYLPDRRDLNRSFPGSRNGSLAGQLAHIFMTEVVAKCDFGIDLHSGAIHRANLPQIRADLSDEGVLQMASAFDAPVMLDAKYREGSLRQVARNVGCKMLVYEGGEALRFDEGAIRLGVKGIVGVMRQQGMLGTKTAPHGRSIRASSSHWLRAPMGGIVRTSVALGTRVEAGQTVGIVADPIGQTQKLLVARETGIIIGSSKLPVVNRGDAIFHVALVDGARAAEKAIVSFEQDVMADPLFDDEMD